MRMLHYFGALSALVVPALVVTAVTGIWMSGGETHLTVGLLTAIYVVAVHTLLIMFMIVTGRVLKSAMQSRPLAPEFLDELNQFFARKSAYPAALLAAVAVVATAVLGYAQRGFGITPAIHMLAGLGTLLLNLWALPIEWMTLRDNQGLLDRTAAELDRLDRSGVPARELPPESWASPSVRWLLFAAAWWAPYVYWAVVEHRGDFSDVSVHPWVELSVLGVVAAWLARGRSADAHESA